MRLGVLSIETDPKIIKTRSKSFDDFYNILGLNTGNLLFSKAVIDQINFNSVVRVGFDFDPEYVNSNCDALVIPAANWINPKTDFGFLTPKIKKLSVPSVIVGLGAQSGLDKENIKIPDGTKSFVDAISKNSSFISVRGRYSKSVLNSMGIRNVLITGCPSFFKSELPNINVANIDREKIAFSSTRYTLEKEFNSKPSINKRIFELAYEEKKTLIFQSETPEMELVLNGSFNWSNSNYSIIKNDRIKDLLVENYSAKNIYSLIEFIITKGKCYYDLNLWKTELKKFDLLISTRLHGAIISLLSNVPTVLFAHDSRTQEIGELFKIPTLIENKNSKYDIVNNALDYIQNFDHVSFSDNYKYRRDILGKFYQSNGLELKII